MADRYADMVNSAVGARLARSLGLPRPSELRRHQVGGPLLPGPVLVAGAGAAPLAEVARQVLAGAGAETLTELDTELLADRRLGAVVVDASQVHTPADLEAVRAVLAPALRVLGAGGRVVLLGRPPYDGHHDPALGAARRALEGLVRTVAKELRGGGTANLVLVGEGGDDAVESTLRFLLSGRSAYVSGQVLEVGAGVAGAPSVASWERPLTGRVAVVTGAARGIGAAMAEVLARDGAQVVCVDLPASAQPLQQLAGRLGGSALPLDITDAGAGAAIVAHCTQVAGGGLDVMVHNAGITRDRLLVNTDAERWGAVLDVNLLSILRMNEALLGRGGLRDHGRLVLVSSIAAVAGNRGQGNYAASKAGVIGVVRTMAFDPGLAARGITVNAVAPGFIETEMTARIPVVMREVGRRLNSLAQGGLPVDVAEAAAYFAHPGSGAVTGTVLRVCGQNQLGA